MAGIPRALTTCRTSYCPGAGPASAEDGRPNLLLAGAVDAVSTSAGSRHVVVGSATA